MSTANALKQAQDELSNIVDVEAPRQVSELDSFMGMGSVYYPIRDTLEINLEKEDDEVKEAITNSLITKYVTDQTIGEVGLEEIEELESEVEKYRAIEGYEILEEEDREIRSTDQVEQDLIDEHGEEMEEFIDEINDIEVDSRFETDETPSIEEIREIEDRTASLSKDNLRMDIGENEKITERLAALHLSDEFDDVIQEYKNELQDIKEKKEKADEKYWDGRDKIWNELRDAVGDEEVLEAAVNVKTQAMEFDIKTGKVDLNVDREIRGEETEKVGTGYTKQDIAEAMEGEGVEDQEVIDRVYELFTKEENLEEEKDQAFQEYKDRKFELYDELMDELDQAVSELGRELDLYIEPIKQRKWKSEDRPIRETSASLKTLYKAHEEGILDQPRKDYEERLKSSIRQVYDSSEEIEKHLEKAIDLYEMHDGTEEQRLSSTFEKAAQYAA